MPAYVALLRGINVGGKNKLPMAALREAMAGASFDRVSTYIQSGNIVFASSSAVGKLEATLEQLLAEAFALQVPVVVRSATQWEACLAGNPFAEEAQDAPNQVQLALSKVKATAKVASQIEGYAKRGERVRAGAGALWFHYPKGIAQTKLSPAVVDRCVGAPTTARNWRTAIKLQDMLRALVD